MRPPRLHTPDHRTVLVAGAVGLAVAAVVLPARFDEAAGPPGDAAGPSVVLDRTETPRPTPSPEPRPAKLARAGAGARPAIGLPVELRIPALDLRAPVAGVPLGADGVLVPPADPRLVGWWSGGARPGAPRGAALLTGHTVHDGAGVFDDLALLHPGDAVAVVTRGRVVDFRVRTVRELTKDGLASAADRLFDQTGGPSLVLVTCSDFDGAHYLGNTVVVARPVRGREE